MSDDRLRRALLTVATAVTVVLTGAAFALSYDHLATVAHTHGLGGVAGWSWPGCVDAFIAVGELLVFRARLRGEVDPWAVGAAIVGSVGSIALNVAGAGVGATPLTYIVDAVPPAAAMLAFGLLMYQVHTYLADDSNGARKVAPNSDAEIDVPAWLADAGPASYRLAVRMPTQHLIEHPGAVATTRRPKLEAAPPKPRSKPRAHHRTPRPANSNTTRLARARRILAANPDTTGAELARKLGVTERTGQRIRGQLQEQQ